MPRRLGAGTWRIPTLMSRHLFYSGVDEDAIDIRHPKRTLRTRRRSQAKSHCRSWQHGIGLNISPGRQGRRQHVFQDRLEFFVVILESNFLWRSNSCFFLVIHRGGALGGGSSKTRYGVRRAKRVRERRVWCGVGSKRV